MTDRVQVAIICAFPIQLRPPPIMNQTLNMKIN